MIFVFGEGVKAESFIHFSGLAVKGGYRLITMKHLAAELSSIDIKRIKEGDFFYTLCSFFFLTAFMSAFQKVRAMFSFGSL